MKPSSFISFAQANGFALQNNVEANSIVQYIRSFGNLNYLPYRKKINTSQGEKELQLNYTEHSSGNSHIELVYESDNERFVYRLDPSLAKGNMNMLIKSRTSAIIKHIKDLHS